MLNLILVFRLNLKMGIPDRAFMLSDYFILSFVGMMLFMATMTLSARLCPSGIEATLFASEFFISCHLFVTCKSTT